MHFLTDFADQAVVLPVAVTVFVVLLVLGWRRGALAWGLAVMGVLGTMLLLKLIVFACLGQLGWTGLSSPSGHTAASAVVYGGLLVLLAPRGWRGAMVAAAAGGIIALVFGFTRLALEVHTVPDVIVGAAIGVAGTVALRTLAGEQPKRTMSPWLAVCACCAMAVFHGHRMEAENRIRWLALDVWPLNECARSNMR